jgi:cytochrome P450
MVDATATPAHVPAGLVRDLGIEFEGPIDALFPRLDALRDEGPVLWLQGNTGMLGAGAWFLTRAEDIHTALQSPELFSSRLGGDGEVPMIPIFMDPPEHAQYRRLLNPLFAPGVVAAMEEGVRDRIVELIDAVQDRGECDFVADIAVRFPTRVFTAWMGLPEADTGTFVALVQGLMHGGDDDGRADAMAGAFTVLNQLIADRMAVPRDDLMSQIIGLDLDERPLSQDELFRIAFLLFLAGLDTVVAALSFSFSHLASTPADRIALAQGSVPTTEVVEEMLRRHSFVNLPRIVARDTEVAGVGLRAGDSVVLSLPMASRDPSAFDHPTEVDFGRQTNRHYAYGVGPHRCLGSHHARLEMRVCFDEWHSRIPDYRLAGPVPSYAGTVMGVKHLPLAWG